MAGAILAFGFIFSPDRAAIFPAALAGPLPPPPRDVEAFDTGSGLVWFMPSLEPEPSPVIFLFHGNGENISALLPTARAYQSRGLAVAMVEYPGYGGTPGVPTQRSVTEAAVAAYDHVLARTDVDRTRVLSHGFSLGGAVAAQLAARRTVHGLVLESTFASMVAMYRSMNVPGFLCRDPFRTDLVLQNYSGPVLLVHGRNDAIVPASNSKQLLAQAAHASYLELDNGHNDGPSDPVAYWAYIDELLARVSEPISPSGERPNSGAGPR